MRLGNGVRLFDRAEWRRKTRVPDRLRHGKSEERRSQTEDRKAPGKW